jgi:hypothetical protein
MPGAGTVLELNKTATESRLQQIGALTNTVCCDVRSDQHPVHVEADLETRRVRMRRISLPAKDEVGFQHRSMRHLQHPRNLAQSVNSIFLRDIAADHKLDRDGMGPDGHRRSLLDAGTAEHLDSIAHSTFRAGTKDPLPASSSPDPTTVATHLISEHCRAYLSRDYRDQWPCHQFPSALITGLGATEK